MPSGERDLKATLAISWDNDVPLRVTNGPQGPRAARGKPRIVVPVEPRLAVMVNEHNTEVMSPDKLFKLFECVNHRFRFHLCLREGQAQGVHHDEVRMEGETGEILLDELESKRGLCCPVPTHHFEVGVGEVVHPVLDEFMIILKVYIERFNRASWGKGPPRKPLGKEAKEAGENEGLSGFGGSGEDVKLPGKEDIGPEGGGRGRGVGDINFCEH